MRSDPYKRIAGFYDFIFEPVNSSLRQIGLIMSAVSPGMKVLDIGCGTGAQLELYKNQRCEIYGIDTSPSMLAKAKERFGSSAQLIITDAGKTPFSDSYFDLILASFVIHEMPPPTRSIVFKEMNRLVKNEGHILLTDFHFKSRWTMKGIFTKCFITLSEIMAGRQHYKNYRHFMKNKGIPGIMTNEPFEILQSKIVSSGNNGLFILEKKIT